MKNRHLGGTQDFQILSHGAKKVAPKKKTSYVNLAELSVVREPPNMFVLPFWLQDNN
jgi:hypothetical protein